MPPRLRTESDLERAFAAERFLLFKHSTRCGISTGAFAQYRRWADAHPDVATGWIDVLEERALALATAERTGIAHASPQAIRLERGTPVWNASHGAITEASLSAANADPHRERSNGS